MLRLGVSGRSARRGVARVSAARGGVIGGLLALAGALSAQAEGAPQRIVIAGGDLTEIVFALGEGERVVAVDSTSSYPPETETLPKIGYMRRLAPEGVLTTAPDLLLAGAGAGPDSAMDRLRQAGVDVRIGPDDPSLDGVAAKIRFVGDALDRRDEAEALIDRVSGQLAAAIAAAGESEASPRVLFLMTAGRNGVLAAGADTSAQAIIELAGGENAVTGFNGYKPLSAEVALASAPDVLLMPTHAAEAMGGAETALARPELAATPAGRAKRVVVIDGLLLLGFGPRTPEAVSTLAAALHGAE